VPFFDFNVRDPFDLEAGVDLSTILDTHFEAVHIWGLDSVGLLGHTTIASQDPLVRGNLKAQSAQGHDGKAGVLNMSFFDGGMPRTDAAKGPLPKDLVNTAAVDFNFQNWSKEHDKDVATQNCPLHPRWCR
jgi:hypothetical protein